MDLNAERAVAPNIACIETGSRPPDRENLLSVLHYQGAILIDLIQEFWKIFIRIFNISFFTKIGFLALFVNELAQSKLET